VIEFQVTFKEDRGMVKIELTAKNAPSATEFEVKRAEEFKNLFIEWLTKNKAVQTNSN
jgi:hypothetical protein